MCVHHNHVSSIRVTIPTNGTIYVAAPPYIATGGPEVLHQLVYVLRNELGLPAFMYYYPPPKKYPVHPDYYRYGNPFTSNISDSPENVLIVPIEWSIRLIPRFKQIRVVVWWLGVNQIASLLRKSSVRQYLMAPLLRSYHQIASLLRKSSLMAPLLWSYRATIKRLIVTPPAWLRAFAIRLLGDREAEYEQMILNHQTVAQLVECLPWHRIFGHLCQSYYALQFVNSLGVKNVTHLSDYLADEFLLTNVSNQTRDNIILYNPRKGFSFTWKIMQAARHLRFVGVEGMSREQAIQAFKRAKVYIDFGSHLGKDRMPREAAVLRCCVIVGKRGSAANDLDVPIPEAYRFDVLDKEIPRIVRTIESCLVDYESHVARFEEYRKRIAMEPQIFRDCVRKIFGYDE